MIPEQPILESHKFRRLVICLMLIMLQINLNDLFACVCPPKVMSVAGIKEQFEYHDIIFIGEYLSGDSAKTNLIVRIPIKGVVGGDTLQVSYTNSCSFLPTKPGFWMIYAKDIDESGVIDISICSFSRSLITQLPVEPPPLPDRAMMSNKGDDKSNIKSLNWRTFHIYEYIILTRMARVEHDKDKYYGFINIPIIVVTILAVIAFVISLVALKKQ